MANDAGIEAKNVAGAITGMGIDQLISNLAIGIAQGQMNLDMECMKIASFMSTAQVEFGKRAGSEKPDLISLIELGFTPNFYQFVDTILEIRVAVSSKLEEKVEVDTSDLKYQQTELEQQKKYEEQQQSAYGGSSYSGGSAGWWGGGAYWGGSYGYSGSSASGGSAATSSKAKTLSLTTVDAKYASTYNFAVEASSTIKTKIVPVPPPSVFEEIVRAKLKERRDWEERMRWTDQARGILSTTAGLATPVLEATSDKAADPIKGNTLKKENKAKVTKLQSDLAALQENYGQLTTNHWSVIQNVNDRRAADAALGTALSKAAAIAGLFEDPDETKTIESEELQPLLNELYNAMKEFSARSTEMLKRVAAAMTPTQTPALTPAQKAE